MLGYFPSYTYPLGGTMTTLADLRAKLNGEIGVADDSESTPWSVTVRNNAISDGYAELWRQGVWRSVVQDYSSVDGQTVYATTDARRLNRLELLDSSLNVASEPRGVIEPDGSGTTQLTLRASCANGYTLRAYGWTAYKSAFIDDADTDDLDAEFNRVPLLKAKAILYRQQLALFVRYGERQAVAPQMNMTIDQVLGVCAAAEREFTEECKNLANLRIRVGQSR